MADTDKGASPLAKAEAALKKFIVIVSHPIGFTAHAATGKDATDAAESVGGHYVNTVEDTGQDSVVHEELGEKIPLVVERPQSDDAKSS